MFYLTDFALLANFIDESVSYKQDRIGVSVIMI